MRERVLSKTGILRICQSLLLNRYGIWERFGCEEAARTAGFDVIHFVDDMALRYFFETECLTNPGKKRVIVIDSNGFHVPYDIGQQLPVVDLSFQLLFPNLDEKALLSLPGLDFDHLAFVADRIGVRNLGRNETLRFCIEEMQKPFWTRHYGESLLSRATELAESASSYRDWVRIGKLFGNASRIHHSGSELSDYCAKRKKIEMAFSMWVPEKYKMLSGTVDAKRPVLLSKVNDFIRKGNRKVALILMDGMSFENFFTIKQAIIQEPITFDIQASFSFFPTVTSVARQSVFSGKLPKEHTKPFSLENEEKQWMAYWTEHGYRSHEIGFFKEEKPEISPQMKVVGIVVNICDDLMHDELQGLGGLRQGIETWMKNGSLIRLIKLLLCDGFAVYMTADHGNTAATAEGRFQKPGVLAEPASRRAVIYQSYADAIELDKFSSFRYNGDYLPDGYTAYLFDTDKCYGDRGREYITHGGMTLEEAVVPFIKIGAYYG